MSTRSTPERYQETPERDRWSSPREDETKLMRSWSPPCCGIQPADTSVIWVDTATDWTLKAMPTPKAVPYEPPASPLVAMECDEDMAIGDPLTGFSSASPGLDPESIIRSIRAAFEVTEPARASRKSAAHVLEHLWDQTARDRWQIHDEAVGRAFGRLRRTYSKCEERLGLDQLIERTQSGSWTQLLPRIAKEAMHASSSTHLSDTSPVPFRFCKTPSPVPLSFCFKESPTAAFGAPPTSPSSRPVVQLH